MEECLLDCLTKIIRWIIFIVTKTKEFWNFLGLLTLFVLAIIFITTILLDFSLIQYSMQSIAEISSLFVTLVGATYAIIQYQNHLKEEKRKVLCEYNQRYSTDKNIKSVITWMLKVAITNEIDGDIIDVNTNSNVVSPGIHKKEMFMRFFEELNLRIDKGDLDAKEVYNLFSYYALKFDKLWGFRLDIKDYKNELEMISMNENDRKEFKDCWVAYHSFIQKMKDEEKREKSQKINILDSLKTIAVR